MEWTVCVCVCLLLFLWSDVDGHRDVDVGRGETFFSREFSLSLSHSLFPLQLQDWVIDAPTGSSALSAKERATNRRCLSWCSASRRWIWPFFHTHTHTDTVSSFVWVTCQWCLSSLSLTKIGPSESVAFTSPVTVCAIVSFRLFYSLLSPTQIWADEFVQVKSSLPFPFLLRIKGNWNTTNERWEDEDENRWVQVKFYFSVSLSFTRQEEPGGKVFSPHRITRSHTLFFISLELYLPYPVLEFAPHSAQGCARSERGNGHEMKVTREERKRRPTEK